MTKPQIEALKEVARWIVFFVLSWIITQIINQIVLIPEVLNLKIWEFIFTVPLRALFSGGLTLAGRYLDKLVFEKTKALSEQLGNPDLRKGILPF